jgi:predicted HD superfamily hydrolase involved in NAD metabolism
MSVNYEAARAAVDARLGAKAAAHCHRVGDTASGLAILYDVDPETARIAGILHDWDRERTPEQLLGEAQDAGLTLSDAESARPHLLHARTGAAALREEFPGIDDAVAHAVARHTVGAFDMTPLDMVVYLADMIEPAREYAGVQELRDAVGAVSLGELFALGYQQSLAHIVTARKRIHPDTVAVWNRYVAGGPR